MSSYSHRFCADIHAPAAALCVTETGVLALNEPTLGERCDDPTVT